ncbi:MAG: hypothetical protein R3300_14620 [Candidatus Promineifilaceae bacterium]|nr:hypothetical protein [Candidatus Promineifilaceae bacterium]
MTDVIQPNEAMIHIRFEGRSWDIACRELDIGPMSSDDQVRQALASYFDVEPGKLRCYVIERHENGNMTVRPEAVFG